MNQLVIKETVSNKVCLVATKSLEFSEEDVNEYIKAFSPDSPCDCTLEVWNDSGLILTVGPIALPHIEPEIEPESPPSVPWWKFWAWWQ